MCGPGLPKSGRRVTLVRRLRSPLPVYLSDRDLVFAVRSRQLIFHPEPTEYDTTSIDVHLDTADKAKVWDLPAFEGQQRRAGQVPAALRVGEFEHEDFATEF